MKKVVVISDSFKGTLSSLEICDIAKETIPRFFPECDVLTIPVADGGEGTVACFEQAIGAQLVHVDVHGPDNRMISSFYGKKGTLGIVEMAAAAGLPMMGGHKNPETATTYGVGELIRHAVNSGCTELLLGLGGSATNDGGCGCAAALGVRFYDEHGNSFVPTGGTLDQIAKIDLSQAQQLLSGVTITAMCDVDNPLYGPSGAAHVFGPQKGADAEMVDRLDKQLRFLDQKLQETLGRSFGEIPGAGAAGGFGAGCMAFLNAALKSGIEAVLDTVDFDRKVSGADLVITGEGRIDAQSVRGKVISGIAKRTSVKGIPLLALVGSIADSACSAYDLGVSAMFSINRQAISFAQAAPRSAENYRLTLSDICRLLKVTSA